MQRVFACIQSIIVININCIKADVNVKIRHWKEQHISYSFSQTSWLHSMSSAYFTCQWQRRLTDADKVLLAVAVCCFGSFNSRNSILFTNSRNLVDFYEVFRPSQILWKIVCELLRRGSHTEQEAQLSMITPSRGLREHRAVYLNTRRL